MTLDAAPPRRVLVVDDEAVGPRGVPGRARGKGVRGRPSRGRSGGPTASSGEDHFDLIFLDILLPEVGGASVLKAIKRRDPEAMVVLITGYPYHDDTLAALEHGPAMLLRKPIKLTDIHAVLEIVFKGEKPS